MVDCEKSWTGGARKRSGSSECSPARRAGAAGASGRRSTSGGTAARPRRSRATTTRGSLGRERVAAHLGTSIGRVKSEGNDREQVSSSGQTKAALSSSCVVVVPHQGALRFTSSASCVTRTVCVCAWRATTTRVARQSANVKTTSRGREEEEFKNKRQRERAIAADARAARCSSRSRRRRPSSSPSRRAAERAARRARQSGRRTCHSVAAPVRAPVRTRSRRATHRRPIRTARDASPSSWRSERRSGATVRFALRD